MLKINLFILFFTIQLANISAINTNIDSLPKPHDIVKISVSSLLERARCAHFAYEHFFTRIVSFQGELGFYLRESNRNPDDITFTGGVRSQLELRSYPFADFSWRFMPYYSVEVFYQAINLRGYNDYYVLENGIVKKTITPVGFTQTQSGGNLLSGYQWTIKKRFVIDGFAGLGVITIADKYTDAPEGFEPPKGYVRPYLQTAINDYGQTNYSPKTVINVVLGLKIGYAF